MALEQKLSLKLSQKLVMTPSLQQAIKLLQMTRIELDGLLTQELVENPVLEDVREINEDEVSEADKNREKEKQAAKEKEQEEKQELDHEESMADIDLESYFSDYWESSGYASVREIREAPPLENTLSRAPDLYDHLRWQLHMMADVPDRQRQIAELIIGNLDPQGFLVADLEEICALGPLVEPDEVNGALLASSTSEPSTSESSSGESSTGELATTFATYEESEVEEALRLVQSFDPPGVACRNLRESLLLQLDRKGESHDSLAWRMLDEHWDLFLRRQFQQIAKLLGVPLKELEPIVAQIRTLETRPGREFNSERAHYIEPDVVIRKVGDEYVIQLNDDGMPRLRISHAYRRMLAKMRAEGRESEAQTFIKEKIRSAHWLIKSLDQRQRTIYKVANSIIHQQRDFLDHGIDHLRPLVLRDVADDIGMHESTVSRVVSNKYMHTPRGVFPLKYFFHSGIDRDYGENISSLTVKRKIEQLVQGEEPKKPLSDSELMRILKREGIQIARRTVAKYRDELGIPASTDRKQIF